VDVDVDLDVVINAVVVAVVSIDAPRVPRLPTTGHVFAIARGSALECAAILDALETMSVLDEAALKDARELLERVVSMLTGLIRS
jgi:hypothetical protein